jgi:hypothetical protein
MNDRVPLAGVTVLRLRSADCIWAVDRRVPRFCVQLWGQDTPARGVPYGSPARPVDWLSVEIDSTNPDHLPALAGMVGRAKKRLPEAVRRLLETASPPGALAAGS